MSDRSIETNNGNNEEKKASSRETAAELPEPTITNDDSVKKEETPTEQKQQKPVYVERDVFEDEELVKTLIATPCYHGFLTRDDLGVTLQNEGDYLIRVSEVKKKEGGPPSGIVRNIIISLCSSQCLVIDTDKDAKSEARPGELKMRNVVIRRFHSKFAILTDGTHFDTLDALFAHYHVSNTSEKKDKRENRLLKTAIGLQPWEYRHSAVKLGDKLGEGEYGEVRKGVLLRKGKQCAVAVKLMKSAGDIDKTKIQEMMKEARLMRNFKHKNVVRIYGVAVVEQPLYILLELVSGGALNKYLRQNENIGMLELLRMCLGAAQGLRYLHANHCIHRDIAARNCLYSEEKIVKISDFGLSRVQDNNEVKLNQTQKMPIKWLAPESIAKLLFTPRTDVYSYGVLCYEIFSGGEDPWADTKNRDVKVNVATGKHVEIPETCPEKLRSFIHEKIFELDPKRRVMMEDVVRFLEPIINDYLNVGSGQGIKTAAETSQRAIRQPADNMRSVMMPVISTCGPTPPAPRNASNSSRKSKSKVIRKKASAAPVKQSAMTPKKRSANQGTPKLH